MDAFTPNPEVWRWAGGGRGAGTAGADTTHRSTGRSDPNSDHVPMGVYGQFLPEHRLRKVPPLAEGSLDCSAEKGAVLVPSRYAIEQPSRCHPRMLSTDRSGPNSVELKATHAPVHTGACEASPLAEDTIDVAVNGAVLARSQHAVTDVPECRQPMEAQPDRSDSRSGESHTAQASACAERCVMPASRARTRTFAPKGFGEMSHVLRSLCPEGSVRDVEIPNSALEMQINGVRLLDSSSERLAPAAEKTEGSVFVTEGALYPETGRPTVPDQGFQNHIGLADL